MPVYTYECNDCSKREDVVMPMKVYRYKYRQCRYCDGRAVRLFFPPQVAAFKPYTTTHFDGEPVEVRTAKQEADLCAKHRVYRMLDSEKFDKAANRRKREQIKNASLNQVPWEDAVARAEAETGQKLVTPDKPKKRRTCKKTASVQ